MEPGPPPDSVTRTRWRPPVVCRHPLSTRLIRDPRRLSRSINRLQHVSCHRHSHRRQGLALYCDPVPRGPPSPWMGRVLAGPSPGSPCWPAGPKKATGRPSGVSLPRSQERDQKRPKGLTTTPAAPTMTHDTKMSNRHVHVPFSFPLTRSDRRCCEAARGSVDSGANDVMHPDRPRKAVTKPNRAVFRGSGDVLGRPTERSPWRFVWQ